MHAKLGKSTQHKHALHTKQALFTLWQKVLAAFVIERRSTNARSKTLFQEASLNWLRIVNLLDSSLT